MTSNCDKNCKSHYNQYECTVTTITNNNKISFGTDFVVLIFLH